MTLVMVGVGLILLLGGGEVLVRGAVALATRLRLPMGVVGAVVLGFGTSMPEMLTSVSAALAGAPGIAIGNVLGSNIANILLILGLAAVIAPVPAKGSAGEDWVWLALATALGVAVIVLGPSVGRGEGAIMLGALAIYLWRALSQDAAVDPVPSVAGMSALGIGALLGLGLVVLIGGAWLLVQGATGIARALGVGETVIGLTIVAVGTSLPELATSVIAARRGQAGLALGNVLGSNVFNMLAILGLTAMIVPIPVPPGLSPVDLMVVAGSAALLLAVLVRGQITRAIGAGFLGLYAGYVGWLALSVA